ncbi:MAG: diguanylate cyclase [Butyrivibrio sp.]|uniref:sensor domain-containing diguanylate cyclase n=1 Tax=Butyrivibrio sp. TaxID=28121 RepID=UPI0025EDE1A7|nr:diguanylate cyclase [Butyrivibrio sp.]MCR5771721.1 diguanylate cyclase [Butyrivibrio sp.]
MNFITRLKKALLPILAVIIFFITIAFLGSDTFKSPKLYDIVQLEEGWIVTFDATIYNPEILSDTIMPVANKGDVITVSGTLPSMEIDPAVIHFRSILSTVDVYVDGYLVYSFGHDYEEANRMLPKVHHLVDLPKGYSGKDIQIVFKATENNAFSGLSTIDFGNEEDICRAITQDNRLSLAIGIFLVVLGYVLVILAPIFVFSGNHDLSIIFSGLLSMILGLYILCFNDLFWLFSDQPAFYTYLEYLTLYSIPAGLICFLASSRQITNKAVAITISVVNIGFVLITSLLHALNIIHICNFVSWLHIGAVAEGLFVISALIIKEYKKVRSADQIKVSNKSTAMLILGLILFIGCSVIDIIKFNVLKFISTGEVMADINFMTVGALIFILCLILNYFYHCIELISENILKHKLEGLAYTDSLTGLCNRARCELTMAELSGNYTIMSIDLDRLKYINDTYGHAEGDRFIKNFSEILKSSFTDASLLGRMGGDEFIVIFPYIDEPKIARDISCFEDLMNYHNLKNDNLVYSASYGYSSNTDKDLGKERGSHKVYMLADSRMYQMKSEHHAKSNENTSNDQLTNSSDTAINEHHNTNDDDKNNDLINNRSTKGGDMND